MENKDKALCIFHRACLDGFSAAYVVGRFLGFERVQFMQMDYGEPIPDITDRNVYIVDFSFKPDELLPVLDKAKSVIMLDHHKSAIKHWQPLLDKAEADNVIVNKKLLFTPDTTKSGVGLAWEFFYGKEPMPKVLAMCQDYDLWKFNIENTADVVAAIYSMGIIDNEDFNLFHEMVVSDNITKLVETGAIVRRHEEKIARDIIKRCSTMVSVLDYVVPICPVPRGLHSIAGNIMNIDHPFSITYEDQLEKGIRMFSLRSHKEYGVDVSKIAEQLGVTEEHGTSGGGHEHSAGFTVPFSKVIYDTSDHFLLFSNLESIVDVNRPSYIDAIVGYNNFQLRNTYTHST